jgi:hypothetical protein
MASYKLHDSTIGLFAQLIQLALLTGTDIVDNFRTVQLVDDGNGNLIPDPEFQGQFMANINKMIEQADKLQVEITQEEQGDN